MNKDFIKAIIIRAIWTMAEVALGMITVGMSVQEVDWTHMVSVALVAGFYSILKSITAGIPEVDRKQID